MDQQTALSRIRQIVGEAGWVGPEDREPYETEWRGLFHGRAAAVVRPGTTAEVADVVRVCGQAGIPVVPQAGNTGLVGGASLSTGGNELLLSLSRMNRVRAFDADNYTITVEAGCILEDIHRAALAHDRFFPLSLASQGSCRIGGNLATNAGGNNVLRYGNARDLSLGLEVVLPDGRVWNGLTGLRKDNTGYDLKNLFIGSEGTLGIITAAVMKLYPVPRDVETAFVALASLDRVLPLFERLRTASGDAVSGCELMSDRAVGFAVAHVPACRRPVEAGYPWYLLVELTSPRASAGLREVLESVLGDAIEAGEVADAAVAESEDHRAAMWAVRDGIPEGQRHEGASIKNDVAVPVSKVPEFIRRATEAVEARLPAVRVCAFGHVGDGNIHFNLSQPAEADPAQFLDRWGEFNDLVNEVVADLSGSVAAEHGIGRLKRDDLARYKPPEAVDIMRAVKRSLDPDGLMNPGKLIPDPD